MTEQTQTLLEEQLRQFGRRMSYPPTPDLAARRTAGRPHRAIAWGLAAVLLLATLVAVPPVRAYLADWLQIGAVAIEQPLEGAQSLEGPSPPIYALEELSGETTLEAAREAVEFAIGLPAGWGEPDRVFLQTVDPGRQFAILVWGEEGAIELALYVIGSGVQVTKGPPVTIEELTVNGRPGAYVHGEHVLIVHGFFYQLGALVAGPTLVWEGEAGVTYRLEAALSLEEMVRIAETIK